MRIWVLALVAACSVGAPGPGLDPDRELAHIAALTALGPRPAGSAAGRGAVAYLEQQLAGIPLETTPVGDVELPAIEVLGTTVRDARRVHVDDPDVVARFGPAGKAVLFMAHYDTMPESPGAVDDGASVAVLLELARELHAHPPAQPIMIAFTADEEHGLVGAIALAERHGDEIEIAIALDLIGASGRLSLNGAGKHIGLAEMRWLAGAGDRAGVEISAPLPHRVVSRWWPQAERADHGAFTRRGIRAFHLYNRGQDGFWIDGAYHSSRDVLARVDRDALADIGRVLRALVATPPPPHDGDGFWLPVAVNTVVPRAALIAVDAVLALIALLGLAALALGGRAAERTRGAGVLAAIACFSIAAVATTAIDHRPIHLDPAHLDATPVLRATLASALVLAGLCGLATRLVARRFPWIGAHRYLALAIAPLFALGLALLALGAGELAWIWLVPAAALAVAPRLPRLVAPLALALCLLPPVLVLRPNQILEAVFHQFWPTGVPMVVWVAVLAGPAVAGVAWWHRSRTAHGPLGTLVLPVGCGLSVAAGLGLRFLT